MVDLSLRDRYGYLPAVLVMVLEEAGEDVMLRLVSALGGVRISVGPRLDDASPLARAVGIEPARVIHARLMAAKVLRLDVPRMTRTLEHHRRERVLSLRSQGVKIADIALTVGITERAVYYILADSRDIADDRQIEFPFEAA